MKQTVQQVLIFYSTLFSTIFSIMLLTGAKSQRNERFRTLSAWPRIAL